jgi:hypothetical protein
MQESRDRFFALPADESLPPAAHDRQLFACAFFRGAATRPSPLFSRP